MHDNEHRYHLTSVEQGGDAGNVRNGSSDAGEQDTRNAVGDTAAIAVVAAGNGDHFVQDGCSAVDEGVGTTLVVGHGQHQVVQHRQI